MDDLNRIKISIENYNKSKRVMNGFIMNGSTFFLNWEDWIVLPESEKFCERCKGNGKYTSSTGYESICSCPDGQRKRI